MEESRKNRATPAAKALAKKLQIDLGLVKGSGAHGRIHKDDVADFSLESMPKISPLAKKIAEDYKIDWKHVKGTGFRGKIMKDDVLKLINPVKEEKEKQAVKATEEAKAKEILEKDKDIELIPMTAMRKVIAKRMLESYSTAPVFALNYDIDMTEVKALRQKVLATILEKTEKKITFTDIISMAVVKTLMKHKYVNASLSEDGQNVIVHNYVNLAMAVGFDGGLLTPVVYNAEKLSLSELVVAFKDVTTRALNMKLSPSELSGSTFTISNLGMFGVNSFNPIINQPNSAILGVSSIVDKPVVVNGEIVVRPIMTLTLTIDHRVVDGLAGAKFMQDLKTLLEDPISMLI